MDMTKTDCEIFYRKNEMLSLKYTILRGNYGRSDKSDSEAI
jgi:hypothetical protein